MLTEISKNWWLFLMRGLVAILFGVLALIQPGQAWLALVLLFGAFALVDGIFTLIAGIDFMRFFDRGWAVLMEGVVGIMIGLMTLIWLKPATQVLYFVIASWAVVTGFFAILAAIRIRHFILGEWTMIVSGVLSILFGVLLFVYPASGLVALVWVIGIFAILFGIAQMFFAARLHSFRNWVESGEVPELRWFMRL